MAYSVVQRTQEIGIRMALGAQRSDVLGLVVRQGMTPGAIGVVAGLAGAFSLTRVMASLLFNVRPDDPTTYLAISFLLNRRRISRLLFARASCRETRPDDCPLPDVTKADKGESSQLARSVAGLGKRFATVWRSNTPQDSFGFCRASLLSPGALARRPGRWPGPARALSNLRVAFGDEISSQLQDLRPA